MVTKDDPSRTTLFPHSWMTRIDQMPPAAATAVRGCRPVEAGERLGRWKLVKLAGQGGLTRVYRARPADAPDQQTPAYALKLLRPEWQHDARAAAMLAREALVGRAVSHPHLVPVLASSTARAPQFVVMPWLDGATLRQRLACHGPLDVPEALWIARQAAEALAALHAAGWMHGDVKPANLRISRAGHVTLLDLGFARSSGQSGSAADRCVLGTCTYMAPELLTSQLRADRRSDLYSLGAVLFEMLCGRPPFEGPDAGKLAAQHVAASPPDVQRLVPHVPRMVANLVRQMLAKDPLRRPQTPGELVERLASLEIATFSERALV
jgi:serine/threonine protein kinase